MYDILFLPNHISTWSGDRVCENFEFDETENDWIKLVPKIKLFFLILEM
jgi:hypothetical protein